jgi:hypothetical protein
MATSFMGPPFVSALLAAPVPPAAANQRNLNEITAGMANWEGYACQCRNRRNASVVLMNSRRVVLKKRFVHVPIPRAIRLNVNPEWTIPFTEYAPNGSRLGETDFCLALVWTFQITCVSLLPPMHTVNQML